MPSARRDAMKARTSVGAELRKSRERNLAAEMLGEEGEELAGVAGIGLHRLRRHPPLAPKECLPARDLGRYVGGGERKNQGFRRHFAHLA